MVDLKCVDEVLDQLHGAFVELKFVTANCCCYSCWSIYQLLSLRKVTAVDLLIPSAYAICARFLELSDLRQAAISLKAGGAGCAAGSVAAS